jgi:transcriptional regulator with XRE-family HTH domain
MPKKRWQRMASMTRMFATRSAWGRSHAANLIQEERIDTQSKAGLDPEKHIIQLISIEVVRCKCGAAPRIPNIEGLHYTIGLSLIEDEAPLEGGSVRFLRRTLGMTQKEFASKFEMTPQHYSNWERDKTLPPKPVRIAAAVTFLEHLLKREGTPASMSIEDVAQTLAKFTTRTLERSSGSRTQASIAVDHDVCPPAWQIAEFMRFEGPQRQTAH